MKSIRALFSAKSQVIRLLTIAVLFLAGFIIHSCRKDIKINNADANTVTTADIEQFKSIYNAGIVSGSGFATQSLNNKAQPNFIRNLNVKWDKYIAINRTDTTRLVEFDMQQDSGIVTLANPLNGSTMFANKTDMVFMTLKDGSKLNFFMKVVEDFSQTQKSVINDLHYRQIPASFTGNIMFYTLDKKYINGYRYTNGKITATISAPYTKGTKQQVNALKTTLKEQYVCEVDEYYYWECTNGNCFVIDLGQYDQYCDVDDDNGGGVAGSPGGPSGSNGGSGGTPAGPVNADPVDPCTQAQTLNSDTSTFISRKTDSLSHDANSDQDHEYGYDIRLSSIPGSTYLNTGISPGPSGGTEWDLPQEYWGIGNTGYTIGWGHDHPGGDGPNYADLNQLYTLYYGYVSSAPAAQQTFFEQNAKVITTVPTGTYVVMIADWNAFQNVIATYRANGNLSSDYQTYSNQYIANSGTHDLGRAGAAALMQMYGSSINVFYKGNGDANYKAINVQTGPRGPEAIQNVNCP